MSWCSYGVFVFSPPHHPPTHELVLVWCFCFQSPPPPPRPPSPLHELVLVWSVCFQSPPPPHSPSHSNFNGGTQLFLQAFHCDTPQWINCFCFLQQIPDLLGTPMTFSLFEWVKDNLDSLLENQPDAPLPQVCFGSRCSFRRSFIIPSMFAVQILESSCHLCVCHTVGMKNKQNET